MKNTLRIILGLFIVLLSAVSVLAMTYDEASKQDKPIVLYIDMHGCGACQQFEPLFKKMESKFSNKYSFAKEDIYSSKMANTLNVQETPSVFIIQPKSKTSQRIKWNCLSSPGCFEQTLNSYQ